ncbi:MAG: 16S rRNA (cytidine(1402)-2'-O)-methyltransferase [Halobacteriovorax sp.]|nr:16S rRNA (cytidine(1402)-2'-O)-methyltransferase [Halobacteriovorax sp.]
MAKLILITLPIGNMEDLSPRARKALEEGKHFFVEDTRVFKDRLKRADIVLEAKSLFAFHDQDRSKVKLVLELLNKGEDVFLASDAGSPLISDPAFPLVKEVLKSEFEIETLPGPNSVVTALELSGLPPHPFHFHGFLPKEKEKRKTSFEDCTGISGTHIFFESPHRVLDSAEILSSLLPGAEICLAKELTKTFQTVYRFKGMDWDSVKEEVVSKGEFVLLFHIESGAKKSGSKLLKQAEEVLKKPNNKKLSKLLSEILDKNAKELYQELEQNSKISD